MLRQVFGRVFLVWAVFVFLVSWIIFWPGYMLIQVFSTKENWFLPTFRWTKLWGKYLLFFLGIREQIFGKENNAKGQQVVYVCNHRSQLDIPINYASTPPFVILSKVEAAKIPVVGTALRMNNVLVDRRDPLSRARSMEQLRENIKNGKSILLYPEGRRPRESVTIGEFKDGAFRLALEFGLPIVPITIVGSERLSDPKNPYCLYPGKVEVYFDPSIETKDLSANDLPAVKQKVKEIMIEHLNKNL